jgi:hypothetical protein
VVECVAVGVGDLEGGNVSRERRVRRRTVMNVM